MVRRGLSTGKPATRSSKSGKAAKSRGSAKHSIDSPQMIPTMKRLTFVGRVNPNNPGAAVVEHHPKNLWTYLAYLSDWKVGGGPVVDEKLVVTATGIPEHKIPTLRKQFSEGTLVRFSAQRPKRRSWGCISVELVRCFGRFRDRDFPPLTTLEIRDRTFGTLQYDKESQQFSGLLTHHGTKLTLTFVTESVEEAKAMIKLAKPLWRSRRQWFKQFRDLATRSLFDICQSRRSYADEEPLTTKEFLRLLGNPCGLTFWLDDGELTYEMGGWSDALFGDSGIAASGNLQDGLSDLYQC